jgi:hypothetical protein
MAYSSSEGAEFPIEKPAGPANPAGLKVGSLKAGRHDLKPPMTAVVVGTTLRPKKASCKRAASPGGIITASAGFRNFTTFGVTFSDAHPGSFCPKKPPNRPGSTFDSAPENRQPAQFEESLNSGGNKCSISHYHVNT